MDGMSMCKYAHGTRSAAGKASSSYMPLLLKEVTANMQQRAAGLGAQSAQQTAPPMVTFTRTCELAVKHAMQRCESSVQSTHTGQPRPSRRDLGDGPCHLWVRTSPCHETPPPPPHPASCDSHMHTHRP